ncbi:hypothetical protein BDV93DRAFT_334704 [Ceratobasidium sp. AG-I]|nr:hypothetical protein BDV93DRAFT_334704 [Ceratobasidium sp. AG-I]
MMSQMVPYAHENTLAASSVQKMRTSVERILAEMPIRDIQALYENWISNHGPHGHRYVQPWTPLMLALRANQYLLDVLKYEVHLKAKFTLPASLPALWPSYIAFHGLQPAVDAGVLNVIAPATMIRTPNVAKPEAEKPAKGNTSISREYVIVSDMFDIIPAVCNLAADKAYKNTICYVKIVGIMQTLVAQIQKMTSKPVFIIATENSAAIPKALQALDSAAGGLVFCNSFAPPTGKLYTKKLDQVIHVGWAGDVVRCECISASRQF